MKEKLFETIYNDIFHKIVSGELPEGAKVPTEHQIMTDYNVSRTTAIHALNTLEKNKFIVRRRRSGSFVNKLNDDDAQYNIPMLINYSEDFNYELFSGAQDYSITNNCFVSFYNSDSNSKKERTILSKLVNMNISGLIILPCSLYSNIDILSEFIVKKIPITFLDRRISGIKGSLVTSDNYGGMYNLTNYLIKKGHKKIGFYTIYSNIIPTTFDRFNGFCMALADNGIQINNNYIFKCNEDLRHKNDNNLEKEFIANVIRQYQSLEEKPTAICCMHDKTALTLIQEFKKHNIRIPEDLSITGFDNIAAAANYEIPLTTVKQNFAELGKNAVSCLLEQIQTNKIQTKIIDTELIIRKSVI